MSGNASRLQHKESATRLTSQHFMNTQNLIERFIIDEILPAGARTTIDPDAPLISSGIIDSLGLLRLISFLEEKLGVMIGDGDVVPEHFETVAKIDDFVERKRAESA